jgi:hypothetical protein
MAQERDKWRAVVHTVMNFPIFFTSWGTVSFSRRTLLHAVGWLVG